MSDVIGTLELIESCFGGDVMDTTQQSMLRVDEQFLPPAVFPVAGSFFLLVWLGSHGDPALIAFALGILAALPGLEPLIATRAYRRLHHRYASARLTMRRVAWRRRRRELLHRTFWPAKVVARIGLATFAVWFVALCLVASFGATLPDVPFLVAAYFVILVVVPVTSMSAVWAYFLLPHLAASWDEAAGSPTCDSPVMPCARFVENLHCERAVLARTLMGYAAVLVTILVAII